jgi:two-component system phosphate regulon response regulator PhoB
MCARAFVIGLSQSDSIRLMAFSAAVILLVEGARPASSLAPMLEGRGYHVVRASNSKEAISRVRTDAPALAVVNSTSLHTDGLRLCLDLKGAAAEMPVIIIVRAGSDPEKITCADLVLMRPFTGRKLLNRIVRMLPDSVGNVLRVGNFTLNPDSRSLRVDKTEYHLTPMKARLLEVFMRHPGEVLSREFLMKYVWHTDYLGDTRTVEVHIRWVREIIEADANHPVYLQTIRGVGYRLNIEAAA